MFIEILSDPVRSTEVTSDRGFSLDGSRPIDGVWGVFLLRFFHVGGFGFVSCLMPLKGFSEDYEYIR